MVQINAELKINFKKCQGRLCITPPCVDPAFNREKMVAVTTSELQNIFQLQHLQSISFLQYPVKYCRHALFCLTTSCKLVSHDRACCRLHEVFLRYDILCCSQFGRSALRLFIGTERKEKHTQWHYRNSLQLQNAGVYPLISFFFFTR